MFRTLLMTPILIVATTLPAIAQQCDPGGTVATVAPCQETVSGVVTISSNGGYNTSVVSGPEKTWQFRLTTKAMGIDPTTGQEYVVSIISISNNTLKCGENSTYNQSVNYYSPFYVNGNYTVSGAIEARDYNNPGDWALQDTKSCQYTVDNQ